MFTFFHLADMLIFIVTSIRLSSALISSSTIKADPSDRQHLPFRPSSLIDRGHRPEEGASRINVDLVADGLELQLKDVAYEKKENERVGRSVMMRWSIWRQMCGRAKWYG